MQDPRPQSPQMPPEVARYLAGGPPESRQFDFLIGEWTVSATRYKPDGSPLLDYRGVWNAQSLNEGRMILDDFQAIGPTGQAISSYVTLRTYSEINRRWEMVGLAALQPAVVAEWSGEWTKTEMQMSAIGKDPAGNTFRSKIRFFNITKDTFEWETHVSVDDGRNWSKSAKLFATRTQPPEQSALTLP